MERAKAVLILTTVPDQSTADKISRLLVQEKKSAKCVNIIPNIQSVYRWQGEVCQDPEYLLLIKTGTEKMEGVIAAIQSVHPYDLPEIIAFPIAYGLASYLTWLADS